MKRMIRLRLGTFETAVCAAIPRAVAGNPSMSFLSVISFSNFFVASKTFSSNFLDSRSSSCNQKHAYKYGMYR